MNTGVGSGGGPTFERGGGAKICLCPPPHFQTQNLGLGIEPTDICDVILAWLASRCWARQMCPPPHILSRSYAVDEGRRAASRPHRLAVWASDPRPGIVASN